MSEMCFGPEKTRTNLSFLRYILVFDLVLKCCSDINGGNGISFYLLHCISAYSCVVCWNESLSTESQVLGGSFVVIQSYRNVCNWIPKLI